MTSHAPQGSDIGVISHDHAGVKHMVNMAADPRTRQRLEKCWALDYEFDLLPDALRKVCNPDM